MLRCAADGAFTTRHLFVRQSSSRSLARRLSSLYCEVLFGQRARVRGEESCSSARRLGLEPELSSTPASKLGFERGPLPMHTNPTLEIRVRVQNTLKPERRSASIRFELSACLHKPAQRSPLCRQVVLQSARSPLCLRAFARANGVLRQRSSSPSEFFAKGAVLRATGTSARTTISPMCGATLRLRGRH